MAARSCLLLIFLVVFELRMFAGNPTSSTDTRNKQNGDRAHHTFKYLSDEIFDDSEGSESKKEEVFKNLDDIKECVFNLEGYAENKSPVCSHKHTSDTKFTEDLIKCSEVLCAWISEDCKKNIEDEKKTKCSCFRNMWNQNGCGSILKKDKIKLKSRGSEDGYQNDEGDIARSGDDEDSFVFFEQAETSGIDKVDPFNRESYSEEERKCFASRAVLFNGACQELNSVKPCAGEGTQRWLVLEKQQEGEEELLKAVCKVKPCEKSDELYWPPSSACLKTKEAVKTCKGKGQLAKADAYGEGFCSCDEDSGNIEGSEDCHIFYQRGPCKADEVITYNTETGFAVCSKDLCARQNTPQARSKRDTTNNDGYNRQYKKGFIDMGIKKIDPYEFEYDEDTIHIINKRNIGFKIRTNLDDLDSSRAFRDRIGHRRNKRQSNTRKQTTKRPSAVRKTFAPLNGNGECYRLGSSEPCTEGVDVYFKIDPSLHYPRCFKTSQLHLIDGRPGCKVDEKQNCREEIRLAQSNEADFILGLMKQARRKRNA